MRRGFAVLLALFTIILFGAIATALTFAAGEETRASVIMLQSSQALADAESSALQTLANFDWNSGMALRPGQHIRVQSASPIFVARLDSTCFLIQAAGGNTRFQRRIGITIEVSRDSSGVVHAQRVPTRAWTELF